MLLRNGIFSDGGEVYDVFNATHGETDFLLTYPEENSFDPEQEGEFLSRTEKSADSVEIVAVINGRIVGSAGIEPIDTKYKVKHRCDFGIAILKEYWGLGIGSALVEACMECARIAGYTQVELQTVTDNERGIGLYNKFGFKEIGRNPRVFLSKACGYQELVYMACEL